MWGLFSRRDWTRFPNDEVGNALHKLIGNGKPRAATIGIDLACSFPTEADARAFVDRVRLADFTPEIESPDDTGDGRWHVEAMIETTPSHASVTAAIAEMRRTVEKLGGTLSGYDLYW